MRAVKAKLPDGTEEMFIAESDLKNYFELQHQAVARLEQVIEEQKGTIAKQAGMIDAYSEQTIELSGAWERFRKDPKNLKLFFELSAAVQNICNLTIAVKEIADERPS